MHARTHAHSYTHARAHTHTHEIFAFPGLDGAFSTGNMPFEDRGFLGPCAEEGGG